MYLDVCLGEVCWRWQPGGWLEAVGDWRAVSAGGLLKLGERHELDAIASGNLLEGCECVGMCAPVVGERDDTGVLGAKPIAVDLKLAP